jgi:hypothetical protein
MGRNFGRRTHQLSRIESLEGRTLLSGYTASLVAPVPTRTVASGNAIDAPLVRNPSTGMLYGVDAAGGPSSHGIVYQIDPTTKVLTVITTLQSTGPQVPLKLVIDSSGNLYGLAEVSTAAGGTPEGGPGELFELPAGNFATPVVLYAFTSPSFSDTPDGFNPVAMLIDSNNNIDVLTGYGGANNGGVVDQFQPGQNYAIPNVLGSLPNDYHDSVSNFTLASNGTFYGTTTGGGTDSAGTLWELSPGEGVATTIASFDGTNGASPVGEMYVDAQNDVFGAVPSGGSGSAGGVWEYNSTTQQLSMIAPFTATEGTDPEDGLIADSAGNLYGTTDAGLGGGTFFVVNATTHAVSFTNVGTTATGTLPFGAPCPDGNGNFYIATEFGAANNAGAVVELSPGGGGGGGGGGGSATGVTPAIANDTVPTAVVGGAKLHGALSRQPGKFRQCC